MKLRSTQQYYSQRETFAEYHIVCKYEGMSNLVCICYIWKK